MAISRGPKLVTNGLVLALDPSDDNSFAAQNLPIKNGLVLWLDAADDDSFVYSSGTSVSQWRDKSGNNRHFFQSTAGNQPSRSAVINSRKAIQFTAASSNYLRFNSTIINNRTRGSVFVVWRTTGETSQYSQILDNYHGGANAQYAGFSIERNSTNNQYYWGFQDTGFTPAGNIGSTAYSDNTTYCYWITKDSTTITGGYNGTSVTPVPSPSSTWTEDTKGWLIGSWGSNTETFSRFFNGQIAEIVIFNRGLSPTEVKQVNTYLGQKWGIINTDKSVVDTSGGTYVGLLGNGTTSAMPVYDFYNKGALKFDGTDDYIVGTVPSIAASSTVGMWIKSASYNNKIPFSIAGAIYGSGPNIFFNNNFINWNTGDGSSNSFSGSSYPDSNWHYIVVTNDAATNAKLYIDGTLIGTAIYKNTLSTNSNNLWLGRFSGDNNYTINANIAGTQIYNRVLSAAEVLQNYNAQKGKYLNTIVQQGLALNLDAGNPYSYAGAGTTWYDTSGNNKIGTLTGGVTYSSIYGGDFILDGVNGYIQTDLNQNTDNAQITWEAWFWDNSPGGFVSNTAIISNYGPNATTPFTILHIFDNGIPLFGQRNSSGTQDEIYGLTSICNSIWHHVVGVVDNSNMLIYVDGVLQQTKTKITGTTTSGQNLVIGGNHLGRYQSCRIASARCYNIALSAAQVLQNYNATKGRFGL